MCDSYFSQNCLTDFQKEIIDKIIKNVLEEGFYIYGKYDFSNKINTDYVSKSIDFSISCFSFSRRTSLSFCSLILSLNSFVLVSVYKLK